MYRIAQRNRNFGRIMIADILHGSKNQKILSQGLDTLSTYGIMSEETVHRICSIMDYLIEKGYLVLSEGDYSVVKMTAKSADLLRGNVKISMKLPKVEKIAKKKTAEKNTYDKFDYDDALFSELRVLRNKLAMESSVPAYIVFADAALRDMCRKMPVTREEFLNVSGVGEAKADKYSEAFTSLIRNFKK